MISGHAADTSNCKVLRESWAEPPFPPPPEPLPPPPEPPVPPPPFPPWRGPGRSGHGPPRLIHVSGVTRRRREDSYRIAVGLDLPGRGRPRAHEQRAVPR
jgi:hypothetical protein